MIPRSQVHRLLLFLFAPTAMTLLTAEMPPCGPLLYHRAGFFMPWRMPSTLAKLNSFIVSSHRRSAIFWPSGVYSILLNLHKFGRVSA